MKVKILKIFIVILLLIILTSGAFGFYLYELHSQMVEANNIFAIRCTTVNPPLIAYKNSFLKMADAFNNPDKYSQEEFNSFYKGYISGMRKYVKEENKWLAIQKDLKNRWDFQLIQPWYVNKVEDLQWNMYQAYRDDAQYILDIGDQKIAITDFSSNDFTVRDRRNKASQEYFDFYTKASEIKDWRKLFSYVPLPKVCNEKNLKIPNTSGIFDSQETPATPSSEFVPIDPYNVI